MSTTPITAIPSLSMTSKHRAGARSDAGPVPAQASPMGGHQEVGECNEGEGVERR